MFINTISESKSKTHKECPLKYRYKYIDRFIAEPKNTDALQFGSYIHKVLEDGYQTNTLAGLLSIAKEARKDYEFSRDYEPKIETCLKNFLKFNATLAETVSTEMVYEIVHDEKYDIKLNGIIDRVIKGKDGGYLVIDYKTSKRELTKLDLYQDRQMQGYAFAIHKLMDVPLDQITVAHYYPITNHFVTCKYPPSQIHKYLTEKVEQVWKIRKSKKEDFKPRQNQFCNWCDFKDICPEFTPGSLCEQRMATMKRRGSSKKKK